MIEVYVDGTCNLAADLDEILDILDDRPEGTRCIFDARNPQDEWVVYAGEVEEIRERLRREWGLS